MPQGWVAHRIKGDYLVLILKKERKKGKHYPKKFLRNSVVKFNSMCAFL